MILEGYGIRLERLKHEDIELVRTMRNSDHIRNHMAYREIITPAQQEKWFHSINNEHNNYFLIIYNGKKCGMISGAEIDWNKLETGNGGLFIWDEEFHGTSVPLAASLLLTHLSFLIGFRRTYIKTLRDNTRAITYNTTFGYRLEPGQENERNQLYSLTREQFYASTKAFRKTLAGTEVLRCIMKEPFDAMSKKVKQAIDAMPQPDRIQVELIIEP